MGLGVDQAYACGVKNESACRLVWCEAGDALVVYAVVCVRRYDTVRDEWICACRCRCYSRNFYFFPSLSLMWEYGGVIGNGSVPKFTSIVCRQNAVGTEISTEVFAKAEYHQKPSERRLGLLLFGALRVSPLC